MSTASKIEGKNGDVVLAANNVAKSYGRIHALKGVNFEIRRGQVTTLFGENGAGKSTLMKVLSGVIQPTSGMIILDGEPVTFNSSTEARDLGISIIHQELSLAPNMNVRDNIFMGREIRTATGVDFAEEERLTRALLKELEEDIDPLTPVEELRLGQQQVVEIARALSVNSRILIMDEPTSALSASEVEVLFKVIRDLTARGVAIVYISHHLEEALQITNHAVVLRDGTMTAYAPREEIDLEWIVRNMVGENFDLGSPPTGYDWGDVTLSVENLTVPDPGGAGFSLVDRMSLNVRAGEIVCIYGLMGAGRTELLETVAGRLKASGGRVLLKGQDVSGLTIAQRIEKGLVLVPEDRQRDGLVQTMTVGKNLSLASITEMTKGLFTSRKREKQIVNQSIKNVHIKTDGGEAAIGSLSGGNQQKVVIGKMLATEPEVILLDEPSRGIDIGAKAEVFKLLAEKAKQGLAVGKETDHESAEKCALDSTAPPSERSATDNHGSDCRQFVGGACRRTGRRQLRRKNQTCNGSADAGNDIDRHLDALDRNAGQFSRTFVATRRIEPATKCGAVENDGADDGENRQNQNADRHAEQLVETEPVKACIAKLRTSAEIVVGQAIGHQKRHATRAIENAERRNEGRNAQIGDEHTIDRADECAERTGDENHGPDREIENDAEFLQRHALHQEPGDHTGQPQCGANGKIDAAIEDDEQHADGKQAENGHVRRHDEEVIDREIIRRKERENCNDRDQCKKCTTFEQQMHDAGFPLRAVRSRCFFVGARD